MKTLLSGITLMLFIECNNPETPPGPKEESDKPKPKTYFPVLDYLKSEIKYVDSLPVGILKYTTQKGIIDSSYIKPEEFHQLTQEFLPEALNKETFEKEFSESSFYDNTTHYSTFLYVTTNKSLSVHRVDVLVKPENVVYNKVESVYMEKVLERLDTSIIKKLFWKSGHHFLINTEIRTTKPEAILSQVKVVWNSWD